MDEGRNSRFAAAIFDLDGLLIDSEPLWQDAEMEVLACAGVNLSREECLQTTGLRTDKVVEYWFERRPWDTLRFPLDQVAGDINRRVIELIGERGAAKPGVHHAIDFVSRRGLRRAVASSSSMDVISAVLSRLGLAATFEVVHSADFESDSKPAPDVYLGAAKRMNVAPNRCIAFEDSMAGVQAAKAAGMTCVWVPEALWRGGRWRAAAAASGVAADVVIDALFDFDDRVWDEIVGAPSVGTPAS